MRQRFGRGMGAMSTRERVADEEIVLSGKFTNHAVALRAVEIAEMNSSKS